MSTDSVRFVKTCFEEVWSKAGSTRSMRCWPTGRSWHGLGDAGADVSGPAGFKPFVERLRGAFSNIDITVEETIEQGDLIASRWVANMTHTGV